MSSFLTQGRPASCYSPELYDHRFFYVEEEEELCRYSCGQARDFIARYLIENKNIDYFTSREWIGSKEESGENPVVKGFLVENACIASIWKNGLIVNGISFHPEEILYFSKNLKEIKPSTVGSKSCTLCIPSARNQKAIDALLIKVEKNDKFSGLYIVPIQITINKDTHPDSERSFFDSIWSLLESNLKDFEHRIIFVWITPKSEPSEVKRNTDYVSVTVGFVNVNDGIDKALKSS